MSFCKPKLVRPTRRKRRCVVLRINREFFTTFQKSAELFWCAHETKDLGNKLDFRTCSKCHAAAATCVKSNECLSTPHRMHYSYESKESRERVQRTPVRLCATFARGVWQSVARSWLRLYVNSCSLQLRDQPQPGMAYSARLHLNLTHSRCEFDIFHFNCNDNTISATTTSAPHRGRCSIKINMQICTTVDLSFIVDYRLTSVTMIKAQTRKFYHLFFFLIVSVAKTSTLSRVESLLEERSGIVCREQRRNLL